MFVLVSLMDTDANPKKLLDELLKDCKTSEDLLGKSLVLKQLTKDLVERMLEAELNPRDGNL